MTPHEKFKKECDDEIESMSLDTKLVSTSSEWINLAQAKKYSYHFEWFGRPIIQYPQDIVAMQEIIWSVKPDLIIETGIAHGGSLIFSASMLAQLDMCDAIEAGKSIDPNKSSRLVIGLDIDIRPHNKAAIEALTYRMGAHTSSDDPTKYRTKEEEEFWAARDPLARLEKFLRRQGIGQEFFDECDAAGEELSEYVRSGTFALGNPPIEIMFKHVYSEEHPLIEEQLAWLEGYEASFGDVDKGGTH
jgi:hypothetical protein